ncbi:MAG: AMP-binding protein, partial [Flavobacteriaceae bacterium]|nr:AMP-binding protein [Flavobacteriaceae bacterium]
MFLDLDLKNKSSIAVIDDTGSKITYGDLLRVSSEFYSYINKRTLIFILSENKMGSLAGYVACLSNAVVPLIISADTDADYIEVLTNTYKPEYIWLPSEYSDKLSFEKVFEKFDFTLLRTDLKGYPMNDKLSLLLSTSGSTGSPKFVRHTYKNVNESAKNVATFFNISQEDRAIAILPMQYTMGLSVVTSHLYAGATVLLSGANLTDKNFWDFLKDNKATSFTGVPFSFEILNRLRFFRMDLPHLKLITQGGGKLSKKLFQQLAEFSNKTGKKFIATYGQTEGTARMAFLPASKATDKIGSIGKAIPGGKLYIVDENGKKINEPDTEGELIYEGPNVTLGYALNGHDLIKDDENN